MEEISLAGWRRAVEDCGVDLDHFVHQRWDSNIRLPWAIIDSGIKAEHLKSECEKALLVQ